MSNDVDAKLDAIFNAKQERETEAARKKKVLEDKDEAGLQEFLALKDALIRPTLEAMVARLKSRGMKSEVVERADGEKIGNRTVRASIGIYLYPNDGGQRYRGASDYPHLALTVDPLARRIQYFKSTMSPTRGGTAGGDGVVGFDDLSEEHLNAKMLDLIAVVFK